MAEIEVLDFGTAEEFLEALRPSNDRWWDCRQNRATHYFRGHRNQSWLLLASGLRTLDEHNKLTPLYNRVRERMDPTGQHVNDIEFQRRIWINTLNEACHQFSEVCRRVGLPANYFDGWRSVLTSNEFWRLHTLHTPLIEPLAQHHGVPTALLDWTESPLVAAYFAVELDDQTEDPCVWAFDASGDMPRTTYIEDVTEEIEVLYSNSPMTENLFQRSQKGLFTWVSEEIAWFRWKGSWPDLADVAWSSTRCGGVFHRSDLGTG